MAVLLAATAVVALFAAGAAFLTARFVAVFLAGAAFLTARFVAVLLAATAVVALFAAGAFLATTGRVVDFAAEREVFFAAGRPVTSRTSFSPRTVRLCTVLVAGSTRSMTCLRALLLAAVTLLP